MTWPWPSLAAGVLGFACATACSKSNPSHEALASAGPAVQASASASAKPSLPRAARVKAACRALVVSGVATIDGAQLAASAVVDGEHWLELESGASVALRHTLTSREFKLIGPARVLPCRGGAEQLLLVRGQLSTSATLGVRPGAEVLIATPAGTVRYGDAALDLQFGAEGLNVRVKQGEAWVEPESQGEPHFENPVRSGSECHLAAQPLTAPELVAACKGLAEAAAQSARGVIDSSAPGATATLGARAAAHVLLRARARASCAIAAVAAFATGDPAQKQELSASVARSEELWQSVPRPGSVTEN